MYLKLLSNVGKTIVNTKRSCHDLSYVQWARKLQVCYNVNAYSFITIFYNIYISKIIILSTKYNKLKLIIIYLTSYFFVLYV